jgi:hypothetical protein
MRSFRPHNGKHAVCDLSIASNGIVPRMREASCDSFSLPLQPRLRWAPRHPRWLPPKQRTMWQRARRSTTATTNASRSRDRAALQVAISPTIVWAPETSSHVACRATNTDCCTDRLQQSVLAVGITCFEHATLVTIRVRSEGEPELSPRYRRSVPDTTAWLARSEPLRQQPHPRDRIRRNYRS